ncbi:74ee9f1b-6fdc-4f20-8a06-7af75e69aaa8 [Sclerotinia trifoliorum]|uniref:74ee9f1b-6fdc-4f20-8a06-7af75e69aaa8 n=1 Tax=Sclerotinia trifoliorum TaxID=28548 RepID=A0A8H2VN03_9HELO|nr:74ee9f1b-6fdc-4f20-8a06-7af75e69aaa8 [Sclerotinia trifoliorum]
MSDQLDKLFPDGIPTSGYSKYELPSTRRTKNEFDSENTKPKSHDENDIPPLIPFAHLSSGALFGYDGPPKHGLFAPQHLTCSLHGWKDVDGVSIPFFSVLIRHARSWLLISRGRAMPSIVNLQKEHPEFSDRYAITITGPTSNRWGKREFTVLHFNTKPHINVRSERSLLDLHALMSFGQDYKVYIESKRFYKDEHIDVWFTKWLKNHPDLVSHQSKKRKQSNFSPCTISPYTKRRETSFPTLDKALDSRSDESAKLTSPGVRRLMYKLYNDKYTKKRLVEVVMRDAGFHLAGSEPVVLSLKVNYNFSS